MVAMTMKTWLGLMGIAVLAMGAPFAAAQNSRAPEIAEVEAYCKSATDTSGLGECARRRLVIAEAELTRVYNRALAMIEAAPDRPVVHKRDWRRAMTEAQRHWRAWVKQDCGPVVSWEMRGSSTTPAASAGCELERVVARIADLRSRYRLN